ncbi:PREDICTED: protein rolling stone-like isoform X2 [Priapulus caudatus]|uniref:Protein rolling stone-like isoform X2 n=1 Tax=Priapulus caudatus TaxID=37621 RepID=A0ABM1EZT3_PRICU|nr:PREDICTED: protein rolling stone-like isoform X2 [Priapulus caudatus]
MLWGTMQTSELHTKQSSQRTLWHRCGERAKWFIYITNLGFAVLNLHLIHAFIVSVIVYKSSVRTANVQEADSMASAPPLPCYLKSDWFLFNLACNIAFTLTVCYWALLFNGQTDGVDINTHAINSVYVIVDVIVSATPVRLLHMWIAQLGALVYVVFTAIYWAAGGTGAHGVAYIYSVLDYGNAPGQAVITAAVILLLVVPIAQVALFLLSAARGSLVDHCCIATRDKQPIIEDVVMTTNL